MTAEPDLTSPPRRRIGSGARLGRQSTTSRWRRPWPVESPHCRLP